MRAFKHVKFSRRTARKNPQMIIREYLRIIEETKKELEEFNKKKYRIELDDYSIKSYTITGNRKTPSATCDVNYVQLKSIMEKIEENDRYGIELTKNLFSMRNELSWFRYKFMNHLCS